MMCDSRQPLNGADSEPVNLTEGDCLYCGALDGEPCNPDCLGLVENYS